MAFKIIVCAKQVPDTNVIKINPKTGTLIRDGVPSILNHDDANALEEALKKYSLTLESLLLIKLIYVRDYYVESKYLEGDTLLREVEAYKGKFLDVDKYIEELKINRDKYKEKLDIYTKSRNKYE